MKRKYLLLSLVLVAAMAILNTKKASSNKAFPLPGEVNDPISPTTCAQSGCHPSPVLANDPSILTIDIDTSSSLTSAVALTSSYKFIPGQTYYISFLLNSNTGAYGFQMTAFDALNDSMAGSFTALSASTERVTSANNRSYIGHKNAGSTLNWVFTWTAPTVVDPVKFYYAYNTSTVAFLDSNVSGVPGGKIYNGNVTIDPVGYAGINSISDYVGNLNIYPNPVSSSFNVSFNLKQSEALSLNVYSVDGQITRKLMDNDKRTAGQFNQSFDISDLPAGIYLVKLNAGSASITNKITKL
jgi:Secretion system C-terminal sorting domain/Reeler domain